MTAAVRRATLRDEAAARAIVEEYFDAIDVYERDDAATLRRYLDGPGALWLAADGAQLAGCVALRPLPQGGPLDCEVKRLYVRPAFRGTGLADALMDALEAHAREAGYRHAYLDTKADLAAAIRLYERRGYTPIARYNDNPEAAVFMRRDLGG